MSVCAVVGGQFGSEGKGLIVGEISKDYGHHVRVGAANAGHTLYTWDGGQVDVAPGQYEKHVMQQLPCAAYANPDAALYVGPGALVSLEIFVRELITLAKWRQARGLPVMPPIYMDPRAHIITQEQIDAEQETGLAERIGSTSTIAKEGIGTAAADRVLRAERCVQVGDAKGTEMSQMEFRRQAMDDHIAAEIGVQIRDVPMLLARDRVKLGNYHILLEGTQGTGLSNTTSFFPYCTSRNTTVAGLCADAGVAPTHVDRVILVCRTYPIRVAGPSGPFFKDSDEITWDDIGIDPENERTTVTKKVRRVATFSMEQVEEAVVLNGATEIALTFADYIDPNIAGKHGGEVSLRHWPKVQKLAEHIEEVTQVPVTMVGTGPHSVIHHASTMAAAHRAAA